MKASTVLLSTLKTYADHTDAIEAIENNRFNSDGDWFSGNETTLKKVAVNKIAAIYRQIERKWPESEQPF